MAGMADPALDSLNWSICTDEAEDVLNERAEPDEPAVENQGMQLRCALTRHAVALWLVRLLLLTPVWWLLHTALGRSSGRTLLARQLVEFCATC